MVRLRRARRRRVRRASPTALPHAAARGRGARRTAVTVSVADASVHLLRHGEVHNPDRILYGRLPGFRLSETGRAAGRRSSPKAPRRRRPRRASSPRRCSARRRPRRRSPRRTACRARHRRRADRGGQRVRGPSGRGRRRRAARRPQYWPLLRNPFTPSWGEPYLRDRAPHAGRRAPGARARRGPRGACACRTSCRSGRCAGSVAGQRLWHDPRAAAVRAGVGDLAASSTAPSSTSTSPTAEPARRRSAPTRDRRMRRLRLAARRVVGLAACSRGLLDQQGRRRDGGAFQFVAPGGQTEITYDPPSQRGTRRRGAGAEPARPGADARARRATAARSSCSTSGARGAGRAAPRRPTSSRSRGRGSARRGGARHRRARRPAGRHATSPHAAGVTYDSIFDYPGRSLAGLGGVPAQRRAARRSCWTGSTASRPCRWCRSRWPKLDPAGAAPGRPSSPRHRAGHAHARCARPARCADAGATRVDPAYAGR